MTCSNGFVVDCRAGVDAAGADAAARRHRCLVSVEEALAGEGLADLADHRWRGRGCRRRPRPCWPAGSASGGSAAIWSRVRLVIESTLPAIGRPSGESPHAWCAKRLCTTSSGSSSCMAISSRITSRSASTSSPVSSELVIMSPRTSTASGRSSSSTRAWKQVYSFAVNALNSPPTSSSATEMSSAERSRVPLKSRCSRKCEAPWRVGVSSREPTPTHTPMLADRTPAMLLGDDPQAAGQERTTYARGHLAVGVLHRLEGAGRADRLGTPGERPTGQQELCWPVAPLLERVVTRRRSPRRSRRRPRRRTRTRRRPGPATACRGRRSRRSRPGSSDPPRRRPRRCRPACRRRGRAAC